MYLSNRDILQAIQDGRLIFDPPPERIDATSVDLHLDRIEEARIWDITRFRDDQQVQGNARPELRIARYHMGRHP